MGPPTIMGLRYVAEPVDEFDDIKIMELIDRFAGNGYMVWKILTLRLFHDSYYLKTDVNRLAFAIVRISGGKVKKGFVLQVIDFCAEIGLLEKKLLSQNVITSVEIQRSWESAKAASRSKAKIVEYNLLGGESTAGLGSSCPDDDNNATITPDNATITPDNATITPTKEKKEKEKKVNETIAAARADEDVISEFAHIKTPTDADMKALTALIEQYGKTAVIASIRSAASKGGHSVKYVERILDDVQRRDPPGVFGPTHSSQDIETMMYDEWFGGEINEQKEPDPA